MKILNSLAYGEAIRQRGEEISLLLRLKKEMLKEEFEKKIRDNNKAHFERYNKIFVKGTK